MMEHQPTPADQLPAETSQDSTSSQAASAQEQSAAQPLASQPLAQPIASQSATSTWPWRQASSDFVTRADWRSWFFELPAANRTLLTLGSLFIGLGVLQMALPPVVRGAAIALRPYSEGGRQDHCMSNLKSLGLAVMQYSQDYDEHYVPVRFVSWKDSGSAKASGSTESTKESFLQDSDWPQVLQSYLPRDRDMLCQNSRNPFDELTGSSYGYNPVFAQVKVEEITDPANTLLMADRGTQHPLYLLPPQLPWTQGNTTVMEGTVLQEQSNIAFRHNAPQPTSSSEGVVPTRYSNDARSAVMLYADGHVKRRVMDTGANGTAGTTGNAELSDITLWGGDPVSKAAQAQIQTAYTSLSRINEQLESGTLRTLQSGQKQGAQKQDVAAAQAVLPDLLAQWTANRENRQLQTNPEDQTLQELNYNSEVEALGWRTALLWQRAGSPTFLQQLQETQSRQLNAEQQVIQKGSWREYDGLGVLLSVPEAWNVSEEMSSQYMSTYIRSHLPGLWVMLEKGERSQIARRAPVDWSGMEKDYRNRYGSKYQRVRIGTGTLGGERAGLWEFTVQDEDGPALRKLYLGVSHPWQSYVLVCVAPVNDYSKWQSTFERIRASFRFNPIAEE